ncbi:MAG TPA: ribosome-associated protein [Gallionella sp.]|nr:ribosome-associated protein [Gallionella sp.]
MNPHNPENIPANLPDEFDDLDDHDDLESGSDYPDDQDEPDDDEPDDTRDNTARSSKVAPGRGLRSLPVAAEEEEELPPSKTKIKKQMHDLQDLGEELVELSKDQLAQLDLPETLYLAIREMSRINKFGARRRQMQYIGKLMRDVDTAPINAKLDIWKGTSQQHIGYMHQVERWRDRLLESDTALTELLTAYPDTDVQRLRTLIRNAQKERESGKPGKNYREIFQVLRDIIPVAV